MRTLAPFVVSRFWFPSAFAVLIGLFLAESTGQVASAQPAATSVYLEGASTGPGESFVTQVVAFVAAGDDVASFEVTISFNPAIVTPIQADPGEPWDGITDDRQSSDGRWLVSAPMGGRGCEGGGTCVLAVLRWRAVAVGSGAASIFGLRLVDSEGQLLDARIAATAIAVTSSGSSRLQPGGSTVGLADGTIALAVAILAGIGISVPLLVAVRRHGESGSPHQALPHLTGAMAAAIAQYLAQYESAGTVDMTIPPLQEALALEAASTRDPSEEIVRTAADRM